MNETSRAFTATLRAEGARVFVELPFDASAAWGDKDRHHVRGAINGIAVRGPLLRAGDAFRFLLGPAWRRDAGLAAGNRVEVVLEPEGPQREELAPDLTTALDAEPAARRFFESLPTFYRKGYLRWVDATKRRPDLREQRIAELVTLLKDGQKERLG